VILDVEWEDTCIEPQVERAVLVYNKTNVSGLQTFLGNKFVVWASKGSSMEDMEKFKKYIVYESIEPFVPHKTLKIRILNITRRLND